MSNLTFRDAFNQTSVYLDRKLVGAIKWDGAGWRYHPKGGGSRGERFDTIEAVKRSLADDEKAT